MSGMNGPRPDLLALARTAFGFTFAGAADVTGVRDGFLLPPEVVAKYPRAVSLGFRLADGVLDEIRDAPTPLYFHHYRQANALLDRGALQVAAEIQARGGRALPVAASQIVDWENQKGHVPHKRIAVLAGLGWIGRNNLLVHPELGARVRLVTVLTDLPLETAGPRPFGCGACRACLAACPAGAIRERPEDFDHRGCYEQLREFRARGLVGQYICGLCVKACPGRRPGPSAV